MRYNNFLIDMLELFNLHTLHVHLQNLLLVTTLCIIFTNNPVYSVLFLILTFCETASILILFKIEFLGLLFIIIYVGAITVLFLFVVMMLNVKNELKVTLDTGFYLILLLATMITISQYITNMYTFDNITILKSHYEISNFYLFFDNFHNIDILGQILYNEFLCCFLLSGIILLVAMIGAIVLTLNFKSHRKNELVNRQLSRGITQLSYFD